MLLHSFPALAIPSAQATDWRELARDYLRSLFWVDLLSLLPFDEIALSAAGLAGASFVNDPTLAWYLTLFKLLKLLRC